MLFSDRDLRKLIVPLVVEQLLAVTIGMADTLMVASCGEAAVSGISLVDTISILLVGLFGAMASGGAVVAAQYIGKKDREMVGKASTQLFLAVGIFSLVLMFAALFGNCFILKGIYGGVEEEVMRNAEIYFYISAVSYPFLGIYNSGAALFRAVGNSKISMQISFVSNLLNVVGNAVLIFGFDMGVAGAGFSTLAARVVSAVAICGLLAKSSEIPMGKSWKPDGGLLYKILYIGVPSGVENSIFQIGKLLLSSLIASFGTVAITANAVVGNIGSFQLIPGNAIGMAMITVIGQCIGAKEMKQASYYNKKLIKTAYLFMIVLGVVTMVIARPACELYQLSEETTNLTVLILIYNSICCMLVHPLSFAEANALRAAGDVKYTMIVSIASMWICRIVLAYVLADYMGMGLFGVWIAMTIDWCVRAAFFTGRVRSGKWTSHANRLVG